MFINTAGLVDWAPDIVQRFDTDITIWLEMSCNMMAKPAYFLFLIIMRKQFFNVFAIYFGNFFVLFGIRNIGGNFLI